MILEALENNKSVYFEHYFWSKKYKHLIYNDDELYRGFSVSKSYDESDDPNIYVSCCIAYSETYDYLDYLNKLFHYPNMEISDFDDGYYYDFCFNNIDDFKIWLNSINLMDYNIEFYDY